MKKTLKKRIKKWLKDFEELTEICSEPDTDTLEGDAYSIFNEILYEEKHKKRTKTTKIS